MEFGAKCSDLLIELFSCAEHGAQPQSQMACWGIDWCTRVQQKSQSLLFNLFYLQIVHFP